MAKVSRIPSGEVSFEIEDPTTVKTVQLESWSVDLVLQRLDNPDMPKRYPGINIAKITIPTLDGGKYKYALVSKFTSKLNPTLTRERVFDGEFTIPEATAPTTTPATGTGTTFGSTLGVPFDFELELNGNPFPSTFNQKVTTDLVSRLNNLPALKAELTFFLNGKDAITQNITRKFSGPDIDKDPELKKLAGEIIAKTQSLSSDIKGTQDIALFSSLDNEPLINELATVILANNVVFPPSSGAPPISASGDPLSDESMKELADELLTEETIYKESDAVEDRTEQIEKEAKKLQALMDKNKHDMQGLLTIIQTPINDENAIKLRDLFINQIGHFEKDLDETIKETKKLLALKTELNDFEKLKGDIEAEKGPTEIKNTEFHENMFKTDKGKKLFRSYTSKINNANDIITEHNSDIIKIKDEVKKIDLAQVNAQITRLANLETMSTKIKNWIPKKVLQLKSLSKADEIKSLITNDTVSYFNNASKGFNEAKADITAILSEIKETNKVIKDITSLHKRGKKSEVFDITNWFKRKSSRLDGVVSDIETTKVKMRDLLKPSEAKPVTATSTAASPNAKATATATATTNVKVTTTPAKTGGGKGTTTVTTEPTEGPGGSGTGGTIPPTPDNSIMVNLSDHEFYAKLAQRCQALVTDWTTEIKEIYKKGRAKRSLGFDSSFNLKYLNPAIERLRRFTSTKHQVVNLTNLEKDVRFLHEAFDHFMTTIKGQETKLTTNEKNRFRGLTQKVKNDLTQLEELLQEEEKKLAATGTATTSATEPPKPAATA